MFDVYHWFGGRLFRQAQTRNDITQQTAFRVEAGKTLHHCCRCRPSILQMRLRTGSRYNLETSDPGKETPFNESFSLSLEWMPPIANDDFATATSMGSAAEFTDHSHNYLATHDGVSSTLGVHTVWWQWIAPKTGEFTVTIRADTENLEVQAWRRSTEKFISPVAELSGAHIRRRVFSVREGERYYFAVAGDGALTADSSQTWRYTKFGTRATSRARSRSTSASAGNCCRLHVGCRERRPRERYPSRFGFICSSCGYPSRHDIADLHRFRVVDMDGTSKWERHHPRCHVQRPGSWRNRRVLFCNTLPVVAGQTYHILAAAGGSRPKLDEPDFSVDFSLEYKPDLEGDLFDTPIDLGSAEKVSREFILRGAMHQDGEPVLDHLQPLGPIWFRWTAPIDGWAQIFGGYYAFPDGSYFQVFTGDELLERKPVPTSHSAKNRVTEWGEPGLEHLQFRCAKGATYRFAVFRHESSDRTALPFKLSTLAVGPSAAFSNASEIVIQPEATTDIGFATAGDNQSAWAEWTPDENAAITFATDGATFALYEGDTFASLQRVDTEGSAAVRKGRRYYISAATAQPGDVSLKVTASTHPYDAWVKKYNLPADQSEPDANPAGDGYSNLLKLALGYDPNKPANAPLFFHGIPKDSHFHSDDTLRYIYDLDYLTMLVRPTVAAAPIGDHQWLELIPETSEDGVNWRELEIERNIKNDDTFGVAIRPSSQRRLAFLRLRANMR